MEFPLGLFVSMIFKKGAYLTRQSIFHKALKDSVLLIYFWEKASVIFLLNVEC